MATTRDYYETLDVDRRADGDTIKRAFRKLALKYHPDKNPGDKAAEDRFREASEAYQVLSDAEQRARYDRFGHAAFQQTQGAGGGSSGFSSAGFEDIFGDIFGDLFGGGGGRSRRRHGEDLQYSLEVSFEEAAFGCEKTIEIPRQSPCESCRGTGNREGKPRDRCADCKGAGQIRFQQGFFSIAKTCGRCQGTGQVVTDPCGGCRGAGSVRQQKSLKVDIPGGVDNGTRLKLRGEGEHAAGVAAGDLYVLIRVAEHQHFRRDGNEVVCDVHVSFPQAALGSELDVPTLDGSVKMKIKAGTQSGSLFRLRGRGVPDLHGYGRGDQITRIVVDVPRQLDPRQRELLREFAEISGETAGDEHKGFFDKVREKFG